MTAQSSNLSNDELMHVALHANAKGKPQETIEALKLILGRDADHAKALYLLGAVHAEIGMFDDAVVEMTRAVQLDPSLLTAHFQLGLLHYTSERYDDAAVAWRPLDELPNDNAFLLFKNGMLALAAGQYDEAFETMEQGIANNTFNEALNNDMRRIVEKTRASLEEMGVAGASNEQEAAMGLAMQGHGTKRLSAYENNDQDEGN